MSFDRISNDILSKIIYDDKLLSPLILDWDIRLICLAFILAFTTCTQLYKSVGRIRISPKLLTEHCKKKNSLKLKLKEQNCINKYDTVVGEAQPFSSNLMALGLVYTI